LHVLVAHRRHPNVDGRLAELVDHTARDERASRETEIDLVDHLSVADFERLAGLERAGLSVLELDEAAF
jgi:hypothetical protein